MTSNSKDVYFIVREYSAGRREKFYGVLYATTDRSKAYEQLRRLQKIYATLPEHQFICFEIQKRTLDDDEIISILEEVSQVGEINTETLEIRPPKVSDKKPLFSDSGHIRNLQLMIFEGGDTNAGEHE